MDIALLLVEPDASDARVISRTLYGVASVAHVTSIAEAHALLGLRPFDLIISEYRLPDGHGFDLLEVGCPLMLLTHEQRAKAIIRAMEHGVTRYQLKEEGYLDKLRLTAVELVAEHRRAQLDQHLTFDAHISGRLRMTQDCRPVSCSQEAAETLGYASAAGALTMEGWGHHFPSELQSAWQQAATTGLIMHNAHALLYDAAREPVNVLCNIATVEHPEGGYFVDVAFLDVTDALAGDGPLMPHDVGTLSQSHAWIQHILDNTSDVILVTDVTGHIQHVNNRFEAIFGYAPPETIFEVFPPPHDLRIATLMDDALTYNMRLRDEALIQREEGGAIHVEVNIAGMDIGDRRRRLIVTIHNIDERKRAAQRLAQSEADLRAIFESTSVGFMLLDTDMSIRTANGMATDIVQEVLGHNLSGSERFDELILPEHLQAFTHAFQQAIEGQTLNEQISITSQDGERRDYALTFIPVQNTQKVIIGICLTTENITARKRAERALSASESRYRAITELISDYAYALHHEPDGSLPLVWITEAPFRRVTGYPVDGLETIEDVIALVIVPEDRDRARRDLKKCLRGQTTSGEYRIRTQKGHERWVHVTRRPIRSEETGRYDTIVGAVRDITTQRKMEEALRDALQQERELNELKSRFIAIVSHEFRTPLATIRASTDVLRTYFERLTPAQREERFERIGMQVAHMTTLMEDVLSFGRFESGVGSIERSEGELSGFLAALVEEFRQTYADHDVVMELPDGSVPYAFDRRLMRQIVLNLLTNAQKYSELGTAITLTLEASPTMVEIAIRDEGIGIPESDLPDLFTAFHRASNVGTIQGTGLGLSIMKHAVELHGGHITVASEVGKGSTFTITLPR